MRNFFAVSTHPNLKTQRSHLFEYVLAIILATLIVNSLAHALYHNWVFTTDDAYISWRYAENFINGQGLRWYASNNPIEGYSNFSWVMLSALTLKLGLPLLETIKLFSTFSLFIALIALYACARTFLSPLPALLPVYLFSHYQGVIWWTVSGLETSFYLALVFLLTWQSLRAFQWIPGAHSNKVEATIIAFYPRHWWIACALLTLVALTRFEGAVFAVVLAGFTGCLRYKNAITASQCRKIALIAFFAFIIPYTIYFLWRLLYFGHIFPNSYLCKVTIDYYRFYLLRDYLLIAFPCFILSLPYLIGRIECRSILLWLPSLLYGVMLWRADPIIAHYNRLFLAAFGLLSLMTVLGIHKFFNYFCKQPLCNALLSMFTVLIVTFLFIHANNPLTTQLAIEHYQHRVNIRMQVATLLNQKTAKNARVLLSDCGVIPYLARADIEFIDSQCLNNRDLTSKEINLSYPKYARFLQNVVKPDWVVKNYYPKSQSEDDLTRIMAANGFFKDYDFVTTFQSHELGWENGKIVRKQPDQAYMIYKRRN